MDTSTFSDDQIALIGCAVALLVCGGLMYVSYFIGQMGQSRSETDTIPIESHRTVRSDVAQDSDQERWVA